MAAPSNIPNHPLVQMVDFEGDAFQSGMPYHIKNLCSNFQQTLTWNTNGPNATTGVARDDPDCIWYIHYENNDRSRIAISDKRTGRWLAAMRPNYEAPLYLADQKTWWYVYQGGSPGSYWLATSQTQDSFLHTWDSNPNWGATVAMFTNRDSNWPRYYNQPYSVFEDWSGGMSWGLEPAPELKQWKQQQRANEQQQAQNPNPQVQQPQPAQQAGQGTCCNNCGQKCPDVQKAANEAKASSAKAEQAMKAREDAVAEREKHAQQVEADLKQRDDDVAQREKDSQTKCEGAEKREKELEAKEEELKKREEAALASEERVRKTKKGGKADHLAAQEENDKMKEETQKLQAELDAAKKQVEQLRNEVKEAQKRQQNQPQQSVRGSHHSSAMGRRNAPSIRQPERKQPDRTIPAHRNPERKIPRNERPGKSLPPGYSVGMKKKTLEGEKKLAITAA